MTNVMMELLGCSDDGAGRMQQRRIISHSQDRIGRRSRTDNLGSLDEWMDINLLQD